MKTITYIIFCLVFILGCKEEKSKPHHIEQNEFLNITLIDSFSNKLIFDTNTRLISSNFHPMYIGKIDSLINISYNSTNIVQRTNRRKTYKHPDTNELLIFIDTSKIIGSAFVQTYMPIPPPGDTTEYIIEIVDYRGFYKSHPVFIKNLSKDTLSIGYGDYIPLIIEAKDSNNQWTPIQRRYIYDCGTGLTNFYLPNDEILITSCQLFDGDYNTKLRLVFDGKSKQYSNVFNGYIHYSQFKN